jgi:hypothetical protein
VSAARRMKGVVKPQQRPTMRKERTYANGDGAEVSDEAILEIATPMSLIRESCRVELQAQLRCTVGNAE